MPKYIIDTSFFVIAREYYTNTFPSFWREMSKAVQENVITSVNEVAREIKEYRGDQEYLKKWVGSNEIFTFPTEREQEYVREMYGRFPKFKEASSKSRESESEKDKQQADLFIIARARSVSGSAVVTTEKPTYKNNTNKKIEDDVLKKIPDACSKYNVRCINPEVFLSEMKWKF